MPSNLRAGSASCHNFCAELSASCENVNLTFTFLKLELQLVMSQTTNFAADVQELPEPQRFPGIAYGSFAYSGDEEALKHLRNIPGVPQLFEWIYEHVADEYWRL